MKGSEGVDFTGQNRAELYGWTERILVAQEYASLGKGARGTVRANLSKMTGRSLPQITRLIRSYAQTGKVELKLSWRRRFPSKYTARDVALSAEVDRAHQRLTACGRSRSRRGRMKSARFNGYRNHQSCPRNAL